MKRLLCTREELRSFLSGQKTRATRPMKRQPPAEADQVFVWYAEPEIPADRRADEGCYCRKHTTSEEYDECGSTDGWLRFHEKPPYSPGDIVYVAESWDLHAATDDRLTKQHFAHVVYRHDACECDDDGDETQAQPEPRRIVVPKAVYQQCCEDIKQATLHAKSRHWRPAKSMPSWASRIYRRVAGVSVIRLRHVIEPLARAEGFGPGFVPNHDMGVTICVGYLPMFQRRWCERYGEASWDENHYAWAFDLEPVN